MYCNYPAPRTVVTKDRFILLLVSSIWIAGLLIGALIGACAITDHGGALFVTAAEGTLSFIRLYVIRIVPILVIAACAFCSLPLFSLFTLMLKAASFGYCIYGIVQAFGSAGWLIQLLLLFSDIIAVILLLWFSVRNLVGDSQTLKCDLTLCAILIFIACCIDLRAVSPYLMMLLNI